MVATLSVRLGFACQPVLINTSLCVIGKLSKYIIIMHACLKHVSADLRVMMQWLLYLEYLTMHWIG